MIYIFWTCRHFEEATKICRKLLDQHLIACASLLPAVTSIYRWKERIEETPEIKVILKSVEMHFDAIRQVIETHCSYEIPEIVQVNIAQGNPRYLSWVMGETRVL